ncbi:unnamed protein product [Adineta ricciae]|uniref:Angiotensin-converting enzyme n=2 Tax=Adineta ricciae TaxID=249248 RepID=A0A815H554_ADIRI|nr:unnamed protein product [Adineta ricciae]
MSEPAVTTPPASPTPKDDEVKKAATTAAANTKKFEGDGLPFRAKLIGMEDLTVDRDEKICLDSMFKLKAVVRARGEHKQRIQLNLTMTTVKITDETTKAQIACHEIERISFVVIDPRDTRAFGYIYNTSDDRHQFWAIKTERAAAATVLALKELFELAFEKYTNDVKLKESESKPAETTPNGATSPVLPPQANAGSIISPSAGSLLDDNSIWDTTPSPTTPPTQPVVVVAAASSGLDLWGTNDSTPAVAQNPAPKAEESLDSVFGDLSFTTTSAPSTTTTTTTNSLLDAFSTPITTPQTQLPNLYGNSFATPIQTNPINTMPNYLQPQTQQQRPITPTSILLQPQQSQLSSMTPSPISPTPPPPVTSPFAGLDILGGFNPGATAKTTKESFFPSAAPKTIQQMQIEKQKRTQFSQRELKAFVVFLHEEYGVEFTEEILWKVYGEKPNIDDLDTLEKFRDQVDPNDHVDINLWNQLNSDEIKKMPQIKSYADEATAARWLEWHTRISQRYSQVSSLLEWNYETNITSENAKLMSNQNLLVSPFARLTLPIAKKFNAQLKNSTNEDLKRVMNRCARGTISYDDNEVEVASKLSSQLESIFGTTTVCELNNTKQCHTIEPYLTELMKKEKDYDRLTWAWEGWYDACGMKVRPVYLTYIDLLNKNCKANGYSDLSEEWIEDYEMGNATEFEGILDQILKDIAPLYEQIHAYVRGRLCAMYPNKFSCNGPIPAHLLGNMWAQSWESRFDDFIPYPNAPVPNITQVLRDQKFSIHQMYKTAEQFFTSIDLYPMTPKFWARSMFKKPKDRDVVCHASAFDLGYHDDYRTKICTQIDDDYFYTIHHEMGHIEYYMSYDKAQPFVYRSGANSGFHEAIGDTIGMFAISPANLIKLGFLDENAVNEQFKINYLLRLALQKVAFLPFAYAMDKYRFALFRNQINRNYELNSMWWALRVEHGGIMAAVHRNDAVHFDAGAKYHIPSNVPYARYFIAHILQFQFYRALCRIKGQTEDLYMCNIYGNKEVGRRFKEMLAMGSSKSWSDILEQLTGERKLESNAVLDFFKPLYKWLKTENAAKGYPVGWMPK